MPRSRRQADDLQNDIERGSFNGRVLGSGGDGLKFQHFFFGDVSEDLKLVFPMCNEHILISLSFGYFACDNVKTSLPALETLLDAWKACFMLEMNINGIENASSTHSLLHLQKGGGIGYTKIFKSVSNLGGFFPKKNPKRLLWETGFL